MKRVEWLVKGIDFSNDAVGVIYVDDDATDEDIENAVSEHVADRMTMTWRVTND